MLITSKDTNGAALMGGHLDNKNTSFAPTSDDYDLYDDRDTSHSSPTVCFLNKQTINKYRI